MSSFGFAQKEKSPKDYKKPEEKAIQIESRANILVQDALGEYVNDLKVEDFKLFEDGIEQKILSVKLKPSANIGILLDNSGSMRIQLNGIIDIAKALLGEMREKDEAFIIRFIDRKNITVVQDWTSNKVLLDRALGELFVQGGQTALLDAIYLAAEKIAESPAESKRNSIIVISDFDDRSSFYKLKDVLAKAKTANLQIFPVVYNEDPKTSSAAYDLAKSIAEETGGLAFSLKRSKFEEMEAEIVKQIMSEIHSQYEISYISADRKKASRKLRIEVANSAKGEKRFSYFREMAGAKDKK